MRELHHTTHICSRAYSNSIAFTLGFVAGKKSATTADVPATDDAPALPAAATSANAVGDSVNYSNSTQAFIPARTHDHQ